MLSILKQSNILMTLLELVSKIRARFYYHKQDMSTLAVLFMKQQYFCYERSKNHNRNPDHKFKANVEELDKIEKT